MSPLSYEDHRRSFYAIVDDMAMMMLALLDGVLLASELFFRLSSELSQALMHLDLVISMIFCAEFAIRFTISKDRPLFMKRYWWEFLAAIPLSSTFVQSFRLLRLLRVARLVLHVRDLWRGAHGVGVYEITT